MVEKEYKNKFKARLAREHKVKRDVDKIGELYGGLIEFDAQLQEDEFWYFTDIDRETLRKSVLIEIID